MSSPHDPMEQPGQPGQPGQPMQPMQPGQPIQPIEPTRPGPYLVAAAVTMALVLIGGALGITSFIGAFRSATSSSASSSSSGPGDMTDLGAVETFDDLLATHVPDEVDYEMTPPAGGPHADHWLECGVYDVEVPNENAVHSLEHGTVWITYDPDLAQGDIDRLAAVLPAEGILSPYDGLPGPVVVSVWGARLVLSGADDARLEDFLIEYGDKHTAPEPMASCYGGVDASGQPATGV